MYKRIASAKDAHKDGIWAVAWHPGLDRVVTGAVDETVKVWAVHEDRVAPTHALRGHTLGIVSIACDPREGSTLCASSGLDSRIFLWDIGKGELVKKIEAGPVRTWTIAFSSSGKHIAAGSYNGRVNLFDVESGELAQSLTTGGKFITSVAYSPDGKHLACGSFDGIVSVYDVDTGRLKHKLEGHAMPVRALTFSPDSQLLFTGSDDQQLHVYDARRAGNAVTLSGHSSWVLSVDCGNNEGSVLATSSSDKTVKIWSVGERAVIHTFEDHSDQVWGCAYNADKSRLASVSDDCSVQVFECPK